MKRVILYMIMGILTSGNILAQIHKNFAIKTDAKKITKEDLRLLIPKSNPDGFYALSDIVFQDWLDGNWLDSGKDTNFYDGNNNLIRTLELVRDADKWVNSINQLREYYQFNMEKVYQLQIWKNNSWVDSLKISYLYNSNQLLIEAVIQIWKNNSWVNQNKIIYEPNADGSLSTEKKQVWVNNSWTDLLSITYNYNQNLWCSSILFQVYINNHWVNDSLITYSYDVQNKLTEDLFQNWQNNN